MDNEAKKATITSLIKDLVTRAGFRVDEIASEEQEAKNGESDVPVYSFRVTSSDDCSLLLGRRGETLRALEHLVRVCATRQMNERVLISVDINDYKREQLDRAIKTANQVAEKVRLTNRAEALSPMSSYERRFIHLELASQKDIATESIGEEPKRRVIIRPYP